MARMHLWRNFRQLGSSQAGGQLVELCISIVYLGLLYVQIKFQCPYNKSVISYDNQKEKIKWVLSYF